MEKRAIGRIIKSATIPSMELTLKRTYFGDNGTYGFLAIGEKAPTFVTLELPWKNNERQISCIPEGTYTLRRFISRKFGRVWEVTSVPNRTAILIHVGNFLSDIQGCILLGKSISEKGIAQSRVAMADFATQTANVNKITLIITSGKSGS
jgi:hypothetical protein